MITPERQEKVFKYLWKEKCWHIRDIEMDGVAFCLLCEVKSPGCFNTNLTTPDGMSMILKRLVEMGYWWRLTGEAAVLCQIYLQDNAFMLTGEDMISKAEGIADSPELAVFYAAEKEEENERDRAY